MTDRLLELAEKFGVATTTSIPYRPSGQFGPDPDAGEYHPIVVPRNRLDIAHELLNTLGGSVVVRCSGNGWCEALMGGISSSGGLLRIADGAFEKCVVALAERWASDVRG